MKLCNYNEINVSYDFLKNRTTNSSININCFKNKQFSLLIKMNIRYGKTNLLKLIKLIHNNDMIKTLLENISINNVIEDDNDNTIAFSINNDSLLIDFDKKTIMHNNNIFYYNNDYIIDNNNRAVINTNAEQNNLNKFIDFNDPLTNSIINHYWTKNDRKKFANKLSIIINKLPLSFNKKLFTKMKFSNNTIANINEFTLINNNNNRLHCVLNNKHNYDCYIS